MSLGEAQGAIGIDVDLLAAGDHGVLFIVRGGFPLYVCWHEIV